MTALPTSTIAWSPAAQLPAPAPIFPWLTRDEVFRIETPRMWLRWPTPADADRLQMIGAQRSVAEMTGSWPHPLPDREGGRRIDIARLHNAAGTALVLALTLKGQPDRLIGQIGCNALQAENIAIGYMIDPSEAGRGLATEAVGGLIRTLFTHTKIRQLNATSRTNNPASRRVLENNGFVFERSGPIETSARGMVDVDQFALTSTIWQHNLKASRRARWAAAPPPTDERRDTSIASVEKMIV